MTAVSPTLAPVTRDAVRSFVAKGQAKKYRAAIIGLRATPTWAGPTRLDVDGEPVDVVPCVSALAVREAVLRRDHAAWLVVITDRDESDLGESLVGRFLWPRLRVPDPWELVSEGFHAALPDAALVAAGQPLAEALLSEAPPGGWSPVTGRVLTRDAALEALAARVLGIPAEHLDSLGLLEWSAEGAVASRLAELTPAARATLLEWLGERVGPEGRLTLGVVRAGHGSEAVALALIAGLLSGDEPRTGEVRGQLGHRYGGRTPTGAVAQRWAADARTVLERLLARGLHPPVLAAAERRLDEVGAGAVAARSDVLPRGFDGAMHRLGAALTAGVTAGGTEGTGRSVDVEAALADVTGHLLADTASSRRRVGTARAAVRLLRWLATPADAPAGTLPAAVERYLDVGCWVDRACAEVWRGDADEQMAVACQALYEAARDRRAGGDSEFAVLLAEETASDAPLGALLRVEDVLARVVLPLAQKAPLLLLVLDGLSAGVASGIIEAAAGEGLHEWLLPDRRRRSGALTALPSVTEVSRTALLTGRLGAGGQPQESAGFAAACRQAGVSGTVLHKAALERSGAGRQLEPEVAAALGPGGPRVVAVVLNAVDDALDRGDPGRTGWDLDTVTHLRPVLAAAHGRAVVLTSDHGHVIERRDGEMRPSGTGPGANRWRPADGPPPGEGELLVQGRRVGLAGGRVILPWRETLRYGPMKAGYHGGAAAAEVVVPVALLARTDPGGLELAPVASPGWWLASVAAAPLAGPDGLVQADRPPVAEEGTLFTLPVVTAAPSGDLAERVLCSEVFAEQRARARRTPLADTVVLAVLRALLAAGGRLPQAAVAAAAGVPELRVTGTVTALQRYFNVEAYSVLGWDADGVTVVLDQPLLREQFGLE